MHYQSGARIEDCLVGSSVSLVLLARDAHGLLVGAAAHGRHSRGAQIAAAFKGLQGVVQLRVQQLSIQAPVCSLHAQQQGLLCDKQELIHHHASEKHCR